MSIIITISFNRFDIPHQRVRIRHRQTFSIDSIRCDFTHQFCNDSFSALIGKLVLWIYVCLFTYRCCYTFINKGSPKINFHTCFFVLLCLSLLPTSFLIRHFISWRNYSNEASFITMLSRFKNYLFKAIRYIEPVIKNVISKRTIKIIEWYRIKLALRWPTFKVI